MKKQSKCVELGIELLKKAHISKKEADFKNKAINELLQPKIFDGDNEYNQYMDYNARQKVKALSPKMLWQAKEKLISMLSHLSFTFHSTSLSRYKQRLIKRGFHTITKEGGYNLAYAGKNGAFESMIKYGDAFIYITENDDPKGCPIMFSPLRNDQVFIDTHATKFDDPYGGSGVTEVAILFEYPKSLFDSMYPSFKDKVEPGEVPNNHDEFENVAKTATQLTEDDGAKDRKVQAVDYYNIKTESFVRFAGSNCYEMLKLEGKNYPLRINGKAEIPILHWMFRPGAEGFYNTGFMELVYDIALTEADLLNAELQHLKYQANPYEVISVPKDKSAYFRKQMAQAELYKRNGGRGLIVAEQDGLTPNAYNIQSLATGAMSTQAARMDLARQVARLGIQLDELDRGNATATQILSEQAAQESLAKQTMEYNVPTVEKMIKIVLHYMKSIPKSNKMEVHMIQSDRRNQTPGGVDFIDKPRTFPLHEIGKLVKENDVWAEVDAKSGATPNNLARLMKLTRVMPLLPPGTKLQQEVTKEMLALNGVDAADEDVQEASQAAAQQGMPGNVEPVIPDNEVAAMQPATARQTNINPATEANRMTASVRGME